MTEETTYVSRFRRDQRPPTRSRPMTEPHPSDLHTAQHDGGCKRKGCDKKIWIGDQCAWMWNPNRDLNDPRSKDHLVHLECWSDTEWEYFFGKNGQDKKQKKDPPPRVVDEDHKFSWADSQLRKGESVRRRHWDKEKHLRMTVGWREDVEVVYVITAKSKGAYTYPKYDIEAEDWELV